MQHPVINGQKFSEGERRAKLLIKEARLRAGYNMNEFSEMVGISRKSLEDLETTRDYGCHIDFQILERINGVLKLDFNAMFNPPSN